LKSFNVLIDRNGRAKIADFGLSRFTNIGKAARKSFATFNDSDNTIDPLDSMFAEMTGLQGSVLWMAPEIDSGNLHSKAKYGFSVDVYSYAIVLFELITTRLPWEEVQQFVCTRVAEKVKNGQRPTIFPNEIEIAKKYGNVLLELMYVCWSQNPLERPTFVNILSKLRTVDVIINVMKSDHERRASSSSNYAPPKYPTGLVPSRSLRRSADENDEIKDYNKQHKNNLRRKSFSFLPSTNDSINNHRHQHHRVLTSNIHGNNGSASRKIRSFNVEKNNENKINLVESSCDSSSSRTHVSGHTILSNPLPGHVV
jgi:serine/threonine protein kinase